MKYAKVAILIALCMIGIQANAQAIEASTAASHPKAPKIQKINKNESANTRLFISFDDENPSDSLTVTNISICSNAECVDKILYEKVAPTTTKDGQAALIAEIKTPVFDVVSVKIGYQNGGGSFQETVSLLSPLKFDKDLKLGDIMIVFRKNHKGMTPIATAANYRQPEGVSIFYNPTFHSKIKLPLGATLTLPSGATSAPQIFVVGVHDTGGKFPLVDIFPSIKLLKSARLDFDQLSNRFVGDHESVRSMVPRVDPPKNLSGQSGDSNGAANKSIEIRSTGVISDARGRFDNAVVGQDVSPVKADEAAAAACNPAGWCDCSAVLSDYRSQQIITDALVATGTVYLDWCTTIPPYVHITVSNLADSRERFTIKHGNKTNISNVMRLPLQRITSWSKNTQVMINGFTWEGDEGTSAGYGLPNGYVSNVGYTGSGTRILGENRVGGGACDDFLNMTSSYCRQTSTSAGNKLALIMPPSGGGFSWLETSPAGAIDSPLVNSYISSSTSVTKWSRIGASICSKDTLSSRWSAVGTTGIGRVVMVSSTSDGVTTASELCPVLQALKASNSIRLDGGPSAAMTLNGIHLNPLTGLYYIKYGSARYIPYGMKIAWVGF